jgi:hypothetical protein
MPQKLSAMGLRPAEIGSILGNPTSHITSGVNKVKKSKKKGKQ